MDGVGRQRFASIIAFFQSSMSNDCKDPVQGKPAPIEGKARLDFNEMAAGLDRLIIAKTTWLQTYSSGPKKRPDFEIEIQFAHLKVLEQAAADYRRAAIRQGSNSGNPSDNSTRSY